MVDSFAHMDSHEWAVLTAHYGVVLQHLVHAFGTWHYGGPETPGMFASVIHGCMAVASGTRP